MAPEDLGRRSAYRPQAAEIDRPRSRAGGHHRRLPPPHAAPARRLPLCLTAHHPEPDPLLPAPQRHGIGKLPDVDGDKAPKKRFKTYPIGFFHIDIAEVQTEQGRLYLFVAIDRTSKFAFTQLHPKATTSIAADFLRALVRAVPYKVHTVLTDNGIHFTDPRGDTWSPAEIRQMLADKQLFRAHSFELACALLDIDHRLTKPAHPWTNGQVERMNRTIKEATVRRFHYDTHDQLERHLADFVAAYNFAKRLKTLKGLTPYEFICKTWQSQPQLFNANPLQQMPGLNI